VLAEKLAEELDATEYCRSTLWTKGSLGQPSATAIESLEKATSEYDFAVIVLARDDVLAKDAGDELKARDNCVFEAGLFMGALGRERCFLVNSVDRKELPSDLAGITYLPFKEPNDLQSRKECAEALTTAIPKIKDAIQGSRTEGVTARNKSLVTLLSWKDLVDRETLDATQGGQLEEGQVVVTAIQPVETKFHIARQVRENVDRGVSYVYYFYGDASGAQKICLLLQMIFLAPYIRSNQEAGIFRLRSEMVREHKDDIEKDLRRICEAQAINITALPNPPTLQYCIHNATNIDCATAYLKYGDQFLEWARGRQAYEFADEIKHANLANPKEKRAVFYESIALSGRKREDFYASIDDHISKYFPGINPAMRKLFTEGVTKSG